MTSLNLNNSLALGILGVVGVLAAVLIVYLLIGLFQARSLFRRELSAYFLSPIAYVVLVVFLAVMGFLFYETLEQLTASGPKGVEAPMQLLLGHWIFWFVFLFIPPLLTMRLFAEERSAGTLEMLMTAPLRDWQVVLSKFLACYTFYVFMWLPTLLYLPVLLNLQVREGQSIWTMYSLLLIGGLCGVVAAIMLAAMSLSPGTRLVALLLALIGGVCTGIGAWGHYHFDNAALLAVYPGEGFDQWPVLSSYLGLALVGAMFLAMGLLVSSLVRSQMVAALISLLLSLVFVVAGFRRPDLDPSSSLYQGLFFISVPLHFQRDFTRGLVDSRHLVLYVSVTLFCLFLTVRSLESRRWR
jgi:ABC-type transport system involved in multi-copper enzyme maturation permease subunit